MDKRKNDSSSSSKDDAPVAKCRRTSHTVNASILNIPATISPCPETRRVDSNSQTENISTSNTLPDTITLEETDDRLEKIRKEMTNLSEEERRILSDREKASQQTIKDLKSRLADAIKCTQQARRAQSQLSQQKIEMQQKITELLAKNTKLEELLIQRTAEGTSKLNAAASRITELRQKFLKASTPSQRDFYFKTIELQEAKMKLQELETEKITLRKEIQDLVPMASYAGQLDKKLKFANEIISSLRTTVTDKVLPHVPAFCHDELEEIVNVEEDVMDIECEKLGPILHQHGGIGNGMTTVVPEHELPNLTSDSLSSDYNDDVIQVSDDDESSSSLQFYEDDGKVQQEGQGHRLLVGKLYVQVSHGQFFNIKWETHYKRRERGFICTYTECTFKALARNHMEDHVWAKHYGGHFICPRCPDRSFCTKWRYAIKKHTRDVHRK